MSRRTYRRRRTVAALLVLVVAAGITTAVVTATRHDAQAETHAAATPSAPHSPSARSGFDATAHSIDDPASDWVVVDKKRPLTPKDYVPQLTAISVGDAGGARKMRPDAARQVDAMAAQFRTDTGQSLNSQSDYRSYSFQVQTYDGWVASKGRTQADLQSARPGYSEHQTGLAIDFVGTSGGCGLDACFAQTTAGKWLAANAYRWGFILRYPDGKTAVTGYEYEPWHYRYVGVALATEMRRTGVTTMEEFFHLPSAPVY